MPALPQLIAAVVLFGLATYHGYWIIRVVDHVVRDFAWRYAGGPVARMGGQAIGSLLVTVAWIGLLGWGGFWS